MSSLEEVIVIDADGQVLGRLASIVARRLLNGERIVIVNAEKALISGKPSSVLAWYKDRLAKRTHYNPEKTGPKHPRRPDNIVKRAVRGMLPRKKPRGREALRRLRVYIGIPDEYRNAPKIKIRDAIPKNTRIKYMTVGELASLVGWRA
ncbi:MAG: 50S ribosomal protein L13 [Thermoprotei archaeon]|nr:50S ribosomal protein L13 [Thermoprotei archaeon]